jgi:hypothetical protein
MHKSGRHTFTKDNVINKDSCNISNAEFVNELTAKNCFLMYFHMTIHFTEEAQRLL